MGSLIPWRFWYYAFYALVMALVVFVVSLHFGVETRNAIGHGFIGFLVTACLECIAEMETSIDMRRKRQLPKGHRV